MGKNKGNSDLVCENNTVTFFSKVGMELLPQKLHVYAKCRTEKFTYHYGLLATTYKEISQRIYDMCSLLLDGRADSYKI